MRMPSNGPPPPWMKGFGPSLIDRMIDRALEPEFISFNEALPKVLAVLRPYSARSVADAALRALHAGHSSRLDKVRSAPWLALVLVKWKLLQSDAPVHFGREIPQEVFDGLQGQLWRTDNAAGPDSPNFNAMAMVRSIIAGQMEYQRDANAGFMRWPALIARLPEGHGVQRQFREAMGIDAAAFMDLSMTTHVAAGESAIIRRAYFEPLRREYGAKVDAYLTLVSRSLPALRDELRGDVSQQRRARYELKETPYLRRYPLLEVNAEQLTTWHPDVLARGLEDATHLRLTRSFGDAYAERFGPVFEQYVLELVKDANIEFMGEAEIQSRAPGSKAVEALISSEGCNVFVEAKMGLFADQLLSRDEPEYLYDRTKNVRNGIAQGWAMSDLVRSMSAQFGAHADAQQDFLVIVTSRETYLGGGLLLQRLYLKGRFDYPDGDEGTRLKQRMPLQNIFIVSIADFEVVMGHIRATGRALGSILNDAAMANADPHTSAYTLGMHLDKHPGRKGPKLIRTAMEACGTRLGEALGADLPLSLKSDD